MSEFIKFRNEVNKQFEKMSKDGVLFMSLATKDDVWDKYLASFPEGTNEIFRERTEHDCVCCRQFIRYVGRILGQDKKGNLVSVWDLNVDNFYQEVADSLSKFNKEAGIGGIFLHAEKEIGRLETYEYVEDGDPIKWNHFHAIVPANCYRPDTLAEDKGKAFTNCKVLKRSIEEISSDAVETVLDLIASNSIYRGEEHESTILLLKRLQTEYSKAPNKQVYLWSKTVELGQHCSIRNTVIGSLLVDITNGIDLEDAVKSFESKVAPQNYKRSKAVVTPKMKQDAQKKAKDLGIEPSLVRRVATKHDINVSDVLFADNSVKPFMEDSVFDYVKPQKKSTTKDKSLDKVQSVPVDKFIKDILPKAESIELYLENKQESNLMTLVAPQNQNAKCIMKWGNNFSWSYKGEMADSGMKENVKSAGGCVEGDVRFSIQWNDGVDNHNDLDAHCTQPTGGEIYFGNKGRRHPSSGMLDVDITSPGNKVAVENIIFTNKNKMDNGVYNFYVNNYSGSSGRDFKAEIEVEGEVYEYHYVGGFTYGQNIRVADVTKNKDGTFSINHHLPCSSAQKEVWGLQTKEWHKVDMIMNSPNHWEGSGKTGNNHLFFILNECKNPDDVRGFYNEYLIEDLIPHRKVFEVLASNLKASYSDEQLSGVGFSSTRQNEVMLRVKGNFNRVIKVVF